MLDLSVDKFTTPSIAPYRRHRTISNRDSSALSRSRILGTAVLNGRDVCGCEAKNGALAWPAIRRVRFDALASVRDVMIASVKEQRVLLA